MNNQIAPSKPTSLAQYKPFIQKLEENLYETIKEYYKPGELAIILGGAISSTPDLLKCSKASVLGAMASVAKLGLHCNDELGHSSLIPYKGKCKLIIEYKGYIELITRSKNVIDITPGIIWENDDFDMDEAIGKLSVRPTKASLVDPGEMLAAYSTITYRDGTIKSILVRKPLLIKIEKHAMIGCKYPDSSVWSKWRERMWAKSAIRQHSKTLSLAPDIQRNIALDDTTREYDVDIDILEDAESVHDTPEAQLAEKTNDLKDDMMKSMVNDGTIEFVSDKDKELLKENPNQAELHAIKDRANKAMAEDAMKDDSKTENKTDGN